MAMGIAQNYSSRYVVSWALGRKHITLAMKELYILSPVIPIFEWQESVIYLAIWSTIFQGRKISCSCLGCIRL